MPKKLTVAKGWKIIRPDGTSSMLWQHEAYKITGGTWEGRTGSLLEIIHDGEVATARISVPGGYVVVDPENLSECN